MVVIFSQAGIAFWKHMPFVALAIALSAVPQRAQWRSLPSGGPVGSQRPIRGAPWNNLDVQPGTPEVLFPTREPILNPLVVEDEACFPWEPPGSRGTTVSAIRLAVPETAKSEYSKACGEFKKRKLADAEQHVRGAIQNYSKYLAAWVMLGQILQEEQKIDEAHDACSQAITLDPTYLPPYLCLAQLLTLVNKWSDLLALSNRFLGMNRVGDRYSYYYRGLAHLNLQSLPEAQRDVLQAIAIDSEHRQYGLYFLLAQIYGAQGDVVEAAAQVRKFLKYSNVRENKDAATLYLAKLQSQRRETLQTGTPKVQAQLQSKPRPQSNEREQPKSKEQDPSDQSSQQDPVFLLPLPPPQSEQ